MSNVAPIKSNDAKLAAAASAWLDAKREEEAANTRRLAAEKEICLLTAVKSEGSTTTDLGLYKIKTTGKLDRKLDATKLADMDKKIPAPILQRLVSYEPKLSLSELRYIEQNEPAYYAVFAEALTVKPAKTSVTVEIK